jgi:hypothetical protein
MESAWSGVHPWQKLITVTCSRRRRITSGGVIRDFSNYSVWVDGAGESHMESGKTGDAAGAVRNVMYQGKNIRQRLLAISDLDRSQSYEFCGEPPMPVRHYRATLKVTPVTEDNRAFVEWWATFDCAPERVSLFVPCVQREAMNDPTDDRSR